MTEPLVRIIERHGNIPVAIMVRDRTYYCISKAAGILGHSRWTVSRWMDKGYFGETFKLPWSNRIYISAEEIQRITAGTYREFR